LTEAETAGGHKRPPRGHCAHAAQHWDAAMPRNATFISVKANGGAIAIGTKYRDAV
jgi:hypothetical protein